MPFFFPNPTKGSSVISTTYTWSGFHFDRPFKGWHFEMTFYFPNTNKTSTLHPTTFTWSGFHFDAPTIS